MLNSLLFLGACIVAAVVAWGFFQVFGHYAFLIMLSITVALLWLRAGPPKFGQKKK